MGKERYQLIANNKKAYHDYFIDDTYECGLELKGTEVKSVRMGGLNIRESFAKVSAGQIFVYGMHISPYEKGNIFNRDPLRARRLLLHKNEIRKISRTIDQKGYTLIPLKVYFKGGLCKLELGICRGKKLYDKRESIAKKDQAREAERDFKVKGVKF